ncbi:MULTISPECIES: ion channel [unclassified Tolypothrix]|uniref:ion channel n=1 Tax=unclassified Tolypothrix TaxID=2649714 RepID=UPI0005EAA6CE|nr:MULTISPECIES: ion channel [unclassified Tolypothrix]BAY88840.1 K+ channel, inward rectifier [Microchaete diplosiphon NIES-3275]EKF02748.1 inward rectifier potassium channel [Tolypothrix sp. PCC 7601]MBE9083772.1 ATP-sensitive inward rectifier potassium channel 10 [Tolypothrix sp. LEGE 11397]UYD29486.1 ATP-sensitive inward rectifier potassium channel 10 [Tolypothrix sp. PCC 7712]UYD34603.1 ATP-sensitive inward rectifier potassium channel 10 [Tolypothrix sp. PCC 7601]
MRFPLKKLFRKPGAHRRSRVHIKIRDGQFQIVGMGAWYSYWRDPYHLLLTIPWPGFFLLIALAYLATNAVFALAYLAGGDCVENARPGSFLDVFFFSVQTLASIGYGAMYPKTPYANSIVTIEAMVGLMGIAVMTGLAFARFSRPNARVVFSRVAVITPHEGQSTLMFRTANKRRNLILEAQMRVYLMRDEVTAEGHYIRRIHELKLLRNLSPSFTLSWLAMHIIDESSQLYGMTTESLLKTNSSIVVSLSGIDETVAQVLHARHTYSATDLLWNYQFVNIMHETSDGHRYIDYQYFHDAVSLDEISEN